MKLQVFFIFVVLAGVSLAKKHHIQGRVDNVERQRLTDFAGQYEKLFKQEFSSFQKTGVKTPLYEDLVESLQFPPEARKLELADLPQPKQDAVCVICRSAVGSLIDYRREGNDDQAMHDAAMEICTGLNIYPFAVCNGVIGLNLPSIAYIIDERPELTSEIMCGILLQGSNCVIDDFSIVDWEIEVDQNGEAITGPKSTTPVKSEDDLTFIHITDFHYDPAYEVGMNADCGEPACCRVAQGLADSIENAAGRWGDYRDCDTPWEAVEETFNQVARQHPELEYIYYTGDIVDHGVWETTEELITSSLARIFDGFKATFGDIPVFPALGNHEGQPVNQFGPADLPGRSDISSRWLYDFVADQWEHWLPEASQRATIEAGGYYTAVVRPGLRVISLNNNHCYTYNWWTWYQSDYSKIQLQWLHDVLLAAEGAGEKVHILAHIPSGEGSCFKVWAREYSRVVDRFWNTISAQFNGHTHKDEFYIFYSREDNYPINVGWNGGSATPYSDVNLNYRVLFVNQESYEITEHETWIYNLTEANLTPDQTPRWFKSYSFGNEYDIPNLSPASLDGLVQDFAENPAKLLNYWEHKVKQGDTSLEEGCDEECLGHHLCEIVTTEFGNNPRCEQLMDVWWANFPSIDD